MSQEEGSDGPDLTGRPVDEAAEAVLAGDDSLDPGRVRATLETVAEDGVVSETALEAEVSETAKAVSTPETRVEFAAMAVADAEATAESEEVADLDTVRARVERYGSRLETVQEPVDALGPELRTVLDGHEAGANAYEVASDLQRIRAEAEELQRTADELQADAEEFGRWLTDPGVREGELEEAVEAVERSLVALAEVADDLAAGADVPADPGVVWADATLRTRVTSLLTADIRAELEDLRAWPDLDEGSAARLDGLGARLDGLEGRCRDLAERLDDLARPAWTDRFGDALDGLGDTLDRYEPPVPWGEVEAELERYREALGAA